MIDDKSGNIHATKTLDREERAQYTLMAQAVDRDTNRPLEPPSEFIVKVQDINDNPPEFLHETYHANVPERSNVGAYGGGRGALSFLVSPRRVGLVPILPNQEVELVLHLLCHNNKELFYLPSLKYAKWTRGFKIET